jgi:hypothetical protein
MSARTRSISGWSASALPNTMSMAGVVAPPPPARHASGAADWPAAQSSRVKVTMSMMVRITPDPGSPTISPIDAREFHL